MIVSSARAGIERIAGQADRRSGGERVHEKLVIAGRAAGSGTPNWAKRSPSRNRCPCTGSVRSMIDESVSWNESSLYSITWPLES